MMKLLMMEKITRDSNRTSRVPFEILNSQIRMEQNLQESIRLIITRLEKSGEIPSRIAVTSALSGEGVTTVSLALAMTLANDFQAKVGWIDLNWYSPIKLLPQDQGRVNLVSILNNEISVKDVVKESASSNLLFLPAGDLEPSRRPVVARGRDLRDLIDQLSTKFDYLVLDIPSVLSSSDSIMLAGMGEACLFVIHQGTTPRNDVKRALEEIDHLSILGVVLNKIDYVTPEFIIRLLMMT